MPIVVRNVFGLNPPPAPGSTTDETQLPKITPNGIMSIFGQLQVLFKVAPNKPGGKEESYVLSEGQQQDDIEVTHIDEQGGIVTFDNHGTVQSIPLTAAPALNMPVATAGGVVPNPNFPTPGGAMSGRFANRFGGPGAHGRGPAMGGDPNAGNTTPTLGAVPTRSQIYSPQAEFQNSQNSQNSSMTPEQNALMRELQREQLRSSGNPAYRLIPPTPGVTPPDDQPQ